LLILDEVFGFVESVTPAIGMCLWFFEVIVLSYVSHDPVLEDGKYSYFLLLLGFAEVDQLVILQFLL
jgi:hypothetical protein